MGIGNYHCIQIGRLKPKIYALKSVVAILKTLNDTKTNFWINGWILKCRWSIWGSFQSHVDRAGFQLSRYPLQNVTMKYNDFLPRSLVPWNFLGQGANFWTHGQILKINMSKWGSYWSPVDLALSQLSSYTF